MLTITARQVLEQATVVTELGWAAYGQKSRFGKTHIMPGSWKEFKKCLLNWMLLNQEESTGSQKERDSWAEISLHFWSLGLVLAVEELRESPPFNGVNTAREARVGSEGTSEEMRWEPQREEKPRRWSGQTVGESRKEWEAWGKLPARAPPKIVSLSGWGRNNLFGGRRRKNMLTPGGKAIRIQWELGATIPIIVKPGRIAGNDDVVGLFSHVILMQVWVLGLLPLVPRTILILILRVQRLLDTEHSHFALSNPLLSPQPRNMGTKNGCGNE